MSTAPHSPLLTVVEAAGYLRISRSSVYDHIKLGKIKTVRVVARRQFIEIDELNRFIEARKSN
jgi:excisionase family DNA binding protein